MPPRWESPLELLGWVDSDDGFHRLCDGNRWLFAAAAYDWRPVYGVRARD